MSTNSPAHIDRQSFLAYLGSRAVYRETGFLIPVTIEAIAFEPHFEVRLKAVQGIVLYYSKTMPKMYQGLMDFTVGAPWPYLRVAPRRWACSQAMCCWSIDLDEAGCDAVLRVCKEKEGLDPDIVFQLADRIYKYPHVKEIPDTPKELSERIRAEVSQHLQAGTAANLDALPPTLPDRACNGEL